MMEQNDGQIVERTLTTGRGNMQVYQCGKGEETIVLLHGAGTDSAMLSWREIMGTLEKKYTLIAFDLLGYGKSDRPKEICGESFYEIHTQALKEAVDVMELEQFNLAGLSMGGAISISFALEYPEHVKRLIPVDSWGLTKKMKCHRLSYLMLKYTDLTRISYQWCGKYRWLAKWSITSSLFGDKSKVTDEIVTEIMNACAGDKSWESMQDYQRSSVAKNETIPYFCEKLKKLKMPVLFITGEKDPLVGIRDVETAHRLVEESTLHIMKGCKHWSGKECPEEFAEIIDEFIRKEWS